MPNKYHSPYAAPEPAPVMPVSPVRPVKPLPGTPSVNPSVLGAGIAAQAGQALKGRKSAIDRAIEEAGG